MNFWIRNIILAIFLTSLAVAFLANQDFFLSLDGSLGKVDESTIKRTQPTLKVSSEEAKNMPSAPKKGRTSSNAAAVGLSKFYANLHGDMNEKGPKIRNNIVYLPDPKGDLAKILQAREMVVRPYRSNWRGSIESRPFRTGETLNQKLTEYLSVSILFSQ